MTSAETNMQLLLLACCSLIWSLGILMPNGVDCLFAPSFVSWWHGRTASGPGAEFRAPFLELVVGPRAGAVGGQP